MNYYSKWLSHTFQSEMIISYFYFVSASFLMIMLNILKHIMPSLITYDVNLSRANDFRQSK